MIDAKASNMCPWAPSMGGTQWSGGYAGQDPYQVVVVVVIAATRIVIVVVLRLTSPRLQ